MGKLNKRKFILGIFILLNILIVTKINAFGVAYSDFRCSDNPLKLFPGQEKTINLTIQNMIGNEDAKVSVVLKNNAGIAETEDRIYDVKAKTEDTFIPVRIKIPKNARIGTNYTIVVAFDSVQSGKSGGVAVGTGMDVRICLTVMPESPIGLSPTGKMINLGWKTLLAMSIFVILVVAVILIIFKRRKRNFVGMNRYREF